MKIEIDLNKADLILKAFADSDSEGLLEKNQYKLGKEILNEFPSLKRKYSWAFK